MGTKGKRTKWKPRKVDGVVQRARTYTPGMDVVCIRVPNLVADHIRNRAKRLKVSISQLVSDAFMKAPIKPAKKRSHHKKAAPNNAPAVVAKKPAETVAQA
jgi:hypothetical protein